MIYTTYSLEDDKLRLHFTERIHEDTWEKFKDAGFQWAPSQDLLYAVWSPSRERMCISLSDENELFEEESTRAERAEDKAERYSGYSMNASERSESARKRVHDIADRIPFGQPILVGHHSERAARADQNKIERGMRTTVDEWKKSTYWADRAQASLKNAERLERPDVRFRRIKKLKAELRDHQRKLAYYDLNTLDGKNNIEWAKYNFERGSQPAGTFEDHIRILTENNIKVNQEWIDHLEMRIAYEQALYDATPTGADKVGKPLEKSGQVLVAGYIARTPTWFEILRVNKSKDGSVNSVTIPSTVPWRDKWQVSVEDIKDIRTRAEALEAENE